MSNQQELIAKELEKMFWNGYNIAIGLSYGDTLDDDALLAKQNCEASCLKNILSILSTVSEAVPTKKRPKNSKLVEGLMSRDPDSKWARKLRGDE